MRGLALIVAGFLCGCQTSPPAAPAPPPHHTPQPRPEPIVYFNGEPIYDTDLRPLLLESAGGTVLSEIILDRLLEQELARRGLTISSTSIAAEKELLLQTLSAEDENQAVRLMRELRDARGLGDARFEALLRRNAILRLLVQNQVQVSDAAVLQQYELLYGQRYQPRIIVAPTLRGLTAARQRLANRERFSDVAAELSTDISAAQGGLLSPISPVDPTYPQSVRDVIVNLSVDQISDPVAVEGGFALVKLERKIDAQAVELDDVKEQLVRQVRLRVEGALINQLARSMLNETKVVVLDPALNASWQRQKDALFPEQ